MRRYLNAPKKPSRSKTSGGVILKLLGWLMLLAVLGGIYLLRGPILRLVGDIWVVDEPAIAADAIILIGDDNYPAQRASRAAELYHDRRAPLIVATGRYLRPYLSIPELMQRDLTDRGVPANAILRVASFAGNTREEAVLMRQLIEQRKWRKVLVVTSNFHTRRTRYIYERVLRNIADCRVIAARDADYPEDWWQSRVGRKLFFNESVGFVVAVWETRSAESTLNVPKEKLELPPALAPSRP